MSMIHISHKMKKINILIGLRVLWWLILYINLSGLTDAHIADKTLFLGVSVRMFLEEISICISRLSKEDSPHQCGWGTVQSIENPGRNKKWTKGKISFFLSCGIHLPLPWTLEFLLLENQELHQWPNSHKSVSQFL